MNLSVYDIIYTTDSIDAAITLLTFSVSDTASITESFTLIKMFKGLRQTGISTNSGGIYRLSFDSTTVSGSMKVYLGGQLLYSDRIVLVGNIGNLKDSVTVSTFFLCSINSHLSVNDLISITENITLSII